MACFADINVSQGSVATYARCGGIFNILLTTNLPKNLPVNFFQNRLRFDRIMVTSLWPHFFGTPCTHFGSIRETDQTARGQKNKQSKFSTRL